eukprot:TRINITY_DN21233_c1_g1_i1.p2 TRINITY_DN21233_c1_g1~~TRINITY_DN21233_c1_g1_i1.p2  ORF type:complete len:149 (-),score=33.89 TRINITY_DN21233_c1_g1_i1:68-514(-)
MAQATFDAELELLEAEEAMEEAESNAAPAHAPSSFLGRHARRTLFTALFLTVALCIVAVVGAHTGSVSQAQINELMEKAQKTKKCDPKDQPCQEVIQKCLEKGLRDQVDKCLRDKVKNQPPRVKPLPCPQMQNGIMELCTGKGPQFQR